MYPPNDNPIQQQQPGMYYPPAQAPYVDPCMYSQNNMNTMNAPPSYDQATQPIPQPSPMPNVVYTAGIQPTSKTVVPFGATQANLEKVSVQTRCNSCCNEIYTRVNDKVSQNGICWAVFCCFCGSWLLSLLVLCMDGFKVYRHFCPACNAFIGEYSPKMSGGSIALLIFLSLLCVALQIFAVMYFLGNRYY